MTQIGEWIEKHRANGLLIDTNLLIVLLVGRTSPRRIPTCDRTQSYSIEDYRLLERLVAEFRTTITIPHILTEVSNLDPLHGRERSQFQAHYQQWIEASREFFDESRAVVHDPLFRPAGLADAAISMVARHGMLVLTDDLRFWGMLLRRGIDAINFTHMRTQIW